MSVYTYSAVICDRPVNDSGSKPDILLPCSRLQIVQVNQMYTIEYEFTHTNLLQDRQN